MIIRALRLRHGRLALPKPPPPSPSRQCRRSLATTTSSPTFQDPTSTTANPSTTTPIRQHEIRDPTSPIAQNYTLREHQKSRTHDLGSTLSPHYKPHELLSNPPSPKDITLELLMASQAHLGHATSLWHPANAKYIFGVREQDAQAIHVISLDVTAAYLRRACKIVRGVTERGGVVLFVGTREGQARIVVKSAQMAGGCHLFTKWIPGSITNGQQILGNCKKMVVDEHDVEVLGFGDQLEKKAVVKPDLVVCLNPLENYILLHECGLHNIPTVGIVDTDVNPTWVTYPIPANDDSLRCVQVVCGTLGRAGEEGKELRLRRAREEGIISSLPRHGLDPPTQGQAEREKEARAREALLAQHVYEEEGEVVEDEATMELESGMGIEVDEVQGYSDPAVHLGDEGVVVDDAMLQPYERDRPLSSEELAEAPESARRMQDWEVEEDWDSKNRS